MGESLSERNCRDVIREFQSRAPRWPSGSAISGSFLGRGFVLHRSGVAVLLSPIFVGRLSASSHRGCRIDGRFFPHPAAPILELVGAGYAVWCFWHGSVAAIAAVLAVMAEAYARYRVALPRDRELIARLVSEVAQLK